MDYRFQVSRVMHEEHVAVLALMERLTSVIGRLDARTPPVPDTDLQSLLRDLPHAIDAEIGRHFDFEEEHLFPLMNADGEQENVDLLLEQHGEIRPLGDRLAPLARGAQANGFTMESWREFHRLAADFADRLSTHAQLEEASMVPQIDDLLDAETDTRLAETYRAA